ncbi:hypothetical protein F4692_000761 [Nocardioides cavernae]|uniref:PD-(D/E)XK endonuclease-like domain-containing protein n=1 Tax=Nocardioides cavernae TaxID=1921566 RepID=A0A7Y9H0G7_9ACTN|nr:hypothetical protein [Nocardioides cavernae]NYE35657.1 hypothetical protein [Nocardioides cavernae]
MTGAAERREAFAAAGLPVPVYPSKPVQRHDSNAWDVRIGILTHRVIGIVAPQAQHLPSAEHPALIRATVGSIVSDRSLGRLDRARTRITGLTTQYLREFLPPPSVEFLGTELMAGRGRVDLAWRHPTLGVWFDELKTWRHSQAGLDDPTWRQITRYLDAGTTTYADQFAGVRLLTLGNLRACVAISRQGLIEDLAHSPLAPSLLTVGGAA